MFDRNDEYFLWGAGTYGARLIDFIKNDLTFKAVIDNNEDKIGTMFHGLPVISYDDVKSEMKKAKIVISQVYPNAVRNFLLKESYKEYIDFYSIYDFIPRYHWEMKKQVVPKVVNLAPTNFCNLKCDYCQSYMQHVKQPRVTPPEELINDINLLFSHIDSVFLINLCCGESFLNKDLAKVAKHIYDNFSKRYGTMVVLTNGTIVPSDEELKVYAEANVVFSISDYTDISRRITDSMKKLISKCEQYKIKYYLNTSSDKDIWFDYGNPLIVTETEPERLKQRYQNCFKPGNGVRDGKIYLCQLHNVASVVAEVSQTEPGDYFDLILQSTASSKNELLKILFRTPDRGYVEHCKRCNGSITISELGGSNGKNG